MPIDPVKGAPICGGDFRGCQVRGSVRGGRPPLDCRELVEDLSEAAVNPIGAGVDARIEITRWGGESAAEAASMVVVVIDQRLEATTHARRFGLRHATAS